MEIAKPTFADNKLAQVQLKFDLPYLDLYFIPRKKNEKKIVKIKLKIRHWKLKKKSSIRYWFYQNFTTVTMLLDCL